MTDNTKAEELPRAVVQVHIQAAPIGLDSTGPAVVFGFASTEFSQAVFLSAPMDAAEAVQNADGFYKGYLEACGQAVTAWKAHLEKNAPFQEYNDFPDETPETA